jgi:hypothetical protein
MRMVAFVIVYVCHLTRLEVGTWFWLKQLESGGRERLNIVLPAATEYAAR